MKVLLAFGTRPEAIKMVPVVRALRRQPGTEVVVCVTGQHRELLDQVLDLFAITPDVDLSIMADARGLTDITALMLQRFEPVLAREKPDRVLVHGDTATTLAASLASYYRKIPVGHVEAGLRTGDIYQPWPEEINRRVADVICDLYFAPTRWARNNLARENKPLDRIFVTGNTVIDTLFWALEIIDSDPVLAASLAERFAFLAPGRRVLLVTCHRRENFGAPIRDICRAIRDVAATHDLDVVFPVHPNPEVRGPVEQMLGSTPGIHLVDPLEYLPFVYLLRRSHAIMTDSGGIQEEAPSLGKPVFVLRNVTERPEAVEAGTVRLAGTNHGQIVSVVGSVLGSQDAYRAMSTGRNPYGDGRASERIADIVCGRASAIRTIEAVA
jgi:UDP-N-acetylglucosamine 2-epimerase